MPPKAKKGPIGNVLATQQEIDRICENAKAQILKQVTEHSRKHPDSPFTGYALVELEHSLTELYDSMGVSVGKSFKKGLPKVMQDFHDRAAKDMKSDATRNSIMGKVDNAYINRQLQNSFEQIALRTDKMRTDHIHQLRRFSAEIFRTATLTGASPRDVAKQLMDKALEIPGFQFVGKNGVKWSNQAYFKMLARTELMNAGRDTYAQKCAEEGYDLVMLTTSGKCCEGCAKWEGKIFSLTGAVKGFPTKADLEADGVFHPNCTHTFTAVSDFDLAEMGYDVEQPGRPEDREDEEQKRKEEEAARKAAEEEAARKAAEAHKAHRMEQLERAKAGREQRKAALEEEIKGLNTNIEQTLIEKGKDSDEVREMAARLEKALSTMAHYNNEKAPDFKERQLLTGIIERTKGNLEEATKTAQTKLNKILEDAKAQGSYSGIWRNQALTVADYPSVKDSIQKKYDYYSSHPGHDDKVKLLNDFVEKGKAFEKAYMPALAKLQETQSRYESFMSKNDDVAAIFSQERKDKAIYFREKQRKAADKYFRKVDVYTNAPKDEKDAAYNYTKGSGGVNRPLSGLDKNKRLVGVGKVDLNAEGRKHEIEALTRLIDKSSYPDDVWIQRGDSSSNAYNNLLNLHKDILTMNDAELQTIVGREFQDTKFLSCGSNREGGFDGVVMANLYVPKGTKALYCDPFSHFQGEDEILLQRGMTYKVTKAYWGSIHGRRTVIIDLEVHPEKKLKLL